MPSERNPVPPECAIDACMHAYAVYRLLQGTLEQEKIADVEWVSKPYMHTAYKRLHLSDPAESTDPTGPTLPTRSTRSTLHSDATRHSDATHGESA